MKVLKCYADLPQVVGALRTASSFASCLHGRQEQCHQDANDGDDNEQFNEGKSALSGRGHWNQFFEVSSCSQSNRPPVCNGAAYRGSARMSTQSSSPDNIHETQHFGPTFHEIYHPQKSFCEAEACSHFGGFGLRRPSPVYEGPVWPDSNARNGNVWRHR